jgi:HK97 gp10 family phage protein
VAEVSFTSNKTVNFLNADSEIFRLSKMLGKWSGKLKSDMTDQLIIGVNQIRNIIIRSMQETPKNTAKSYLRGGKKHFPSREGHPPAIDTGELVRSITMDVKKLQVEIGADSGAPYGVHLEYGTKNMKARPWLTPAIDNQTPVIISRILDRISREFKP